MQMQHDFESGACIDDGSNQAAVMDFDHIGRAESVDMIEIGKPMPRFLPRNQPSFGARA